MASNTIYAFAVSSVRVQEKGLLDKSALEQLLAAADYAEARRLLADWEWLPTGEDDDAAFSARLAGAWDFLVEVAPRPDIFKSLVLKNDFHNLKAAVKCRFSELDAENFFIAPCTEDAAELARLVESGKFSDLPPSMREGAQDAYNVFVRTQDGQYSDVYIDAAALTAIRAAGRASGCGFIDAVSELTCAAANIKIAVRAQATGKDAHFLQTALVDCDTVSKDRLADAALKGREALIEYLQKSPYAGAADAMAWSAGAVPDTSALEKWFDDAVMDRLDAVKYIFFGPEPLAAYYLAAETEVRNVRILLSAKKHGVKESVIRERMRRLA